MHSINRTYVYTLITSALVLMLTGVSLVANAQTQDNQWKPVNPRLTTPWTDNVSPSNTHTKYPRPQMKREQWKNLNGLWSYAIIPKLKRSPDEWEGEILVPYPVESALSGVKKFVEPDSRLWYTRTFTVPNQWLKQNKRILLHFGAVDWSSKVWVNGIRIGDHRGGYDSFTYDISSVLEEGKQRITVAAWDPSDAGYQPHGKQVREPGGIWYTNSTGIWQTVWLEPVPRVSIKDLRMQPDIDNKHLELTVYGSQHEKEYTVSATAYIDGRKVGSVKGPLGKEIKLPVDTLKLWSPDSPFLYNLIVKLHRNGKTVDRVDSYFGMREIRLGVGDNGYVRLFLNDKELFQFGLLDQGFWPDGLYTAPTDNALKYDIKVTKDLGYNMIRKHVKIEPNRWYYWADKKGVLVWQDMPSGGKHIGPDEKDINRVAQSAFQYKKELRQMIDEHYNHPSIVTWVPFNEGWGQFQTKKITNLIEKWDPTRLIDNPSGWADRGVSDMHDIHAYPGPAMPEPEQDRAAVLGEFGGQALAVKGHLWLRDFEEAPTHFKTSQSRESLHAKYDSLIKEVMRLKDKGLAAAVYTQTTDVEIEVNGIMTYDRRVIKFNKEHLRKLHRRLIEN